MRLVELPPPRSGPAPRWRGTLYGVEDAAILFDASDGIATITLNRPQRLNAITWPMMERMVELTRQVGSDSGVRVLVFKGNGRAFSSGDDIVEGMGIRTAG